MCLRIVLCEQRFSSGKRNDDDEDDGEKKRNNHIWIKIEEMNEILAHTYTHTQNIRNVQERKNKRVTVIWIGEEEEEEEHINWSEKENKLHFFVRSSVSDINWFSNIDIWNHL